MGSQGLHLYVLEADMHGLEYHSVVLPLLAIVRTIRERHSNMKSWS
jgi:hypothetical protein